MADIAPLKGLVYDKEIVKDMSKIVAPPYDVVTPEQQAAYHASHPNNVMNIDLGKQFPEDKDSFEWHKRAAVDFNRWIAEGVLVRSDKPAVYLVETDFADPNTGEKKTRHGFICLLRLEEFGADAKIRPHERTFSAHKAERLSHLAHVQAQLSQIFAVFPDERKQALSILTEGRNSEPFYDFTDSNGLGHRMRPVWDKDVIHALGKMMEDKTIYIADGHHRYETALNYRRMKAEKGVKISHYSPLNYQMVYLCAISDPGLAILPAHRLIKQDLGLSREELEHLLARFFDVRTFAFTKSDEGPARREFLKALKEADGDNNALGLYTTLSDTYYLLKKLPGVERGSALDCWPELLQRLDTVVLTSLIFQEVLGMTEEDLDDATRISYTSKAMEALDLIDDKKAQLAGILNPTKMEQVQDVAEAGLVMPRKSTFFYPKVTTGLVFNPVNPFEEITPAC